VVGGAGDPMSDVAIARDFGFYRSRWTCGTIVMLFVEDYHVQVSRETVRRRLEEADLVWRRPRPVLGLKDPQRAAKLRKIRALLQNLPSDEIALFQDEVDINTNPKIGSMWMRKGQQSAAVTPGNNTKRYLAGSMNWRSGEVMLSLAGPRRNATCSWHTSRTCDVASAATDAFT
jgi:putative transposase